MGDILRGELVAPSRTRPYRPLRSDSFHGVLAPNAKLRRKIIPSLPDHETEPSSDHAQGAQMRAATFEPVRFVARRT
jgi:hypothetical protein